jgi:spore germination cell wall hydrolase CwlJ-like protein
MVTNNNSILPPATEDNYILSTKSLLGKAKFYRRNKDSQNNHDGTSDTSSSVKEKKMIRIIKTVVFLLALALVGTAGYKVINYKLDTLKNARINVSPVTAEIRQKQLDCLARNIYHEAGYEPFEGKVAVAQVTINRTESGQFPSDICQVVYQKNIVYERVLCQFSWYCDSASLKKPMNGPVYTESMEVAKKVLLEGFRIDSIKKALYYHADYVNPSWGKKPVTKIGRHVFYN